MSGPRVGTSELEGLASASARWPFRVALVFLAAGLVALSSSLGLTLQAKRRLATSLQVEGTIVAVKLAQESSSPRTYFPVIQAKDENGQAFEITGSVSSAPPPKIGGAVTLAYEPGHHAEAAIVSVFGIWFFPAVVGILGAVWTLVGLAILSVTRLSVAAAGQKTP